MAGENLPDISYAAGRSQPRGRPACHQNPGFQFSDGGIIRGPQTEKKIALIFTGHTFGEGGETILNELKQRGLKASFFLTGDFLTNQAFAPVVRG